MGDSSMPDKVREVYDLLWHDAAMLNAKRVLAQEWFWHAENMAVLQDAAGDAIRIVRDSVFHDLVVSIQRLLDPATQGKDENLCLERLADIIAQDNSEAGDRLRGRLNSTKAQHAIVTSWRNKRTGHRDLRVALGSNPLAGLSPDDLIAAIKDINGFLNEAMMVFENSEVVWEPVLDRQADSIIRLLSQISTRPS